MGGALDMPAYFVCPPLIKIPIHLASRFVLPSFATACMMSTSICIQDQIKIHCPAASMLTKLQKHLMPQCKLNLPLADLGAQSVQSRHSPLLSCLILRGQAHLLGTGSAIWQQPYCNVEEALTLTLPLCKSCRDKAAGTQACSISIQVVAHFSTMSKWPRSSSATLICR